MLKKSLLSLLLASFAVSVSAHQIWIERDGSAAARIYVGDADGQSDSGDDVAKLKTATQVFTTDPAQRAALAVKKDHLEADVKGAGDVRLVNDLVWEPWKNREGKYEAAIFNARAGRSETAAKLDFELVPTAANGNVFTLTFKGKPLAGKEVTVINPEKWSKRFQTDKEGRITVPSGDKGRFVLVGHHQVAADTEIAGRKVEKLSYITTLSFVAQ